VKSSIHRTAKSERSILLRIAETSETCLEPALVFVRLVLEVSVLAQK